MSFRGFKVVCYDKWDSLPDIFNNLRAAKEAKQKWSLGDKAVIEYINSKSSKAKIIKD